MLAVLLLATSPAACRSTPRRHISVDLTETPASSAGDDRRDALPHLHFSVAAMQSPRRTYAEYSHVLKRLGELVGFHVELMQRPTYKEVDDLLAAGQIDVAIVCTGGYLDVERRFAGATELLAVPQVNGKTTYESLVIVPASSTATRLEDLAGKRFAFTDELSLSGHMFLEHALRDASHTSRSFFGEVLFTHSHDRSIGAVARELVDGAAVDSLVYAYLVDQDADLAKRVRVIMRSEPFELGPVIVSTRLDARLRSRLRDAFLALDRDAEAAVSLRTLRIDRFVAADPDRYRNAAALAESPP